MALSRIGLSPNLENTEVWCFGGNLLTRWNGRHFKSKSSYPVHRHCRKIYCSFSREAPSPMESKEDTRTVLSVPVEEESVHVTRFKMSDFKILDNVSAGLGGRVDEVVFEAIVTNPNSPLYNSRVVLRQLTSPQAQRRGKRAIEVLKKLARRRLMYHSYSMQVHGFVSLHTRGGRGSFTLVHGVCRTILVDSLVSFI